MKNRITMDAAGAFLVGQLERLDYKLHEPLVSYTWTRDLKLRTDASIGTEFSSFTVSKFSSSNTAGGKAFISKSTTEVGSVGLDGKKIVQPLTLWAQKIGYSFSELQSAIESGLNLDEAKLKSLIMKWNMDNDEQAFVGDTGQGTTGLFNHADISVANAPNGSWSTQSNPDLIVADINEVLTRALKNSGNAFAPFDLLMSYDAIGLLSSRKVSDAGNMSLLEYVKVNCISNTINQTPLKIRPVKWAGTAGASGNNRLLAYTNEYEYVRYPVVPLQRQQVVFGDVSQSVAYQGQLGVVEVVYPETIAASDLTL